MSAETSANAIMCAVKQLSLKMLTFKLISLSAHTEREANKAGAAHGKNVHSSRCANPTETFAALKTFYLLRRKNSSRWTSEITLLIHGLPAPSSVLQNLETAAKPRRKDKLGTTSEDDCQVVTR